MELYDMVAISLTTHKVRLIAQHKTLPTAEAIVNLAVFRRGVAKEFFSEVPTGMYKEAEEWIGTPTREE